MRYKDNPLIAAKYNSQRWRKLTKLKKSMVNGFCERCLQKGIYNTAIIIHHKEYINESNYIDDDIFFNIDNLEALCRDCHNKEHFKDEVDYEFDEMGDIIKKVRIYG